jgi:hypothetical protein
VLIESFAHAGLSATLVERLRRCACELYDRDCRQAAPGSSPQTNRELMLSFLPEARRQYWQASLS